MVLVLCALQELKLLRMDQDAQLADPTNNLLVENVSANLDMP